MKKTSRWWQEYVKKEKEKETKKFFFSYNCSSNKIFRSNSMSKDMNSGKYFQQQQQEQ